jgi:hypothetical protein
MRCIGIGVLKTEPTDNKRLERTRHERASLLGCVGEPLSAALDCFTN